MKSTSTYIRLALGLGLAIAIFASSSRASLEDILAPLPVAQVNIAPVTKVSRASAPGVEQQEGRSQGAIEDTIETVEESIDPILASDIRDGLVKVLENTLRPNGEITLIPLREMPDLTNYSRPFNINVINAPGRLSRGNVLLTFQVENEKGILGQWSLPFRTHLYSDVWYPRTPLMRGELASASDFEIGQVDLLVTPDAVPASLEMLLRHEYSRDIKPGSPLVWQDLMERSLVRKGDVVEVSAVQGLLAITVRAVARQDGSAGDLILLKNIDSAKEFSARVIGENRAEIVF